MNYTTTEQSKKLVELGLNSESADMWWLYIPAQGKHIAMMYEEPDPHYFARMESYGIKDAAIPCWSLGALLEVMPEIFEDENDRGCNPTLSKGYDTDMWHCLYRSTIYITDWYKSPTDAAFEMVAWLLENGYIKIEKK